jgi:hypothetical protein
VGEMKKTSVDGFQSEKNKYDNTKTYKRPSQPKQSKVAEFRVKTGNDQYYYKLCIPRKNILFVQAIEESNGVERETIVGYKKEPDYMETIRVMDDYETACRKAYPTFTRSILEPISNV